MLYLNKMGRRRFVRGGLEALTVSLMLALSTATALAALPATTNYMLNSYGLGSGGGTQSTSNYSLEGITGEISGASASTANYTANPGYIQAQQANVPYITLSNPSSYYDKLKFVINNTSPNNPNNPSDALYALQVKVNDATCDFTTGTIRYVHIDDTLGTTLATADYQTYTAWGGSSGQNMIGLAPSTTYCIRAKVTQGVYTESAYGPSSSAATAAQSISFCLFAGATCGSGNTTSFGGLVAGTPATSSPSIGLTFDTNADAGGNIYIYSNGKLQSPTVPTGTINSATADLSSVASGYGAQVASTTSLTAQSPYNLTSNNVGMLSSTVATILTANAPVSGASATINLKAKASNITPPAPNYADTVTIIAAAQF